jgi:hypothetical protein
VGFAANAVAVDAVVALATVPDTAMVASPALGVMEMFVPAVNTRSFVEPVEPAVMVK